MKKQWYTSCIRKRVLISAIVSGIVFLLTVVLLTNDIISKVTNDTLQTTYSTIALSLAFISFVIFLATTELYVIGRLTYYLDKKQYQHDLIEVETLPNEFVEVKLHDKSYLQKFITDDSIKCEAKFDTEKNCIIYKIAVNVEASIDDYAKFLENFEIVE